MSEGAPITASEIFSGDANDILIDAGVPKYSRRLNDKILAAFNHAYADGEDDLARELWTILIKAEKIAARKYSRRRPNQALESAAMWVAFVDARNAYSRLAEDESAPEREAADAFRAMKKAYLDWVSHLRQA